MPPPTELLSEAQWSTLRGVLDRIIPSDDFPGACEAGVPAYLERQFTGDLAGRVWEYRECLDALEVEASLQCGRPFAALTPGEQDALLSSIEIGNTATDWNIVPETFFTMLVQHAAEGYYGDPGNGGNLNASSWDMVGFDASRAGVR